MGKFHTRRLPVAANLRQLNLILKEMRVYSEKAFCEEIENFENLKVDI